MPWYAPLIRLSRAAAYIFFHTVVALLLISGISLVERWIHEMGDPKFFDWIPIRYFFDVMDITIIAVFIPYGVIEAVKVFKE